VGDGTGLGLGEAVGCGEGVAADPEGGVPTGPGGHLVAAQECWCMAPLPLTGVVPGQAGVSRARFGPVRLRCGDVR